MSQAEAISILLAHGTEEKVIDYVAQKIKINEDYFTRLDEEQLITDFLISSL